MREYFSTISEPYLEKIIRKAYCVYKNIRIIAIFG